MSLRPNKSYPEAIRDATRYAMERDQNVYLMGLGVGDSSAIFGSTDQLADRYPDRVIEPPLSEAAFTGIAIGSALMGMRPVLVFQRTEFALLAFDQLINHAAKIRYMSGGNQCCPLVVRIIVGKGWGNGAQHSQSLQSIFAHIPGLRVVMPSDPQSGQGLLLNALTANDPTIIIEHRDLFKTTQEMDSKPSAISLCPRQIAKGNRQTVVAVSAMAAVALQKYPQADIFDLVSLSPKPDLSEIRKSYAKTKALVVMDTGWRAFGVAEHIVARFATKNIDILSLPACPAPTTPALEKRYFMNYDANFHGPF